MCHDLGIIFPLLNLLHGILSKAVIEPSPLKEHHPWCSMTPKTNKTDEKPKDTAYGLYYLPRCSTYNDILLKT